MGMKERTTSVELGLNALIARESSRGLVKLGGVEEQLKAFA